MAKRFTDTDKFKKRWIRNLEPAYKLFWMFILDDCNHAGIWEVDFEIASIYCGTKIDPAPAAKKFKEKVVVISEDKWFIPAFIKFQYGELNPDNRVHNSVLHALKNSGLKEGVYKPLISPLQGVKDKDKDKEKDKDKDKGGSGGKFHKPKIEDIKAYFSELGINGNEHEKFYDFYESKNWMVGKSKMKDWKAAVRNWERRMDKPEEKPKLVFRPDGKYHQG